MKIYKNKYKNIAYKNYNTIQINTNVNAIGNEIWAIVRVINFKIKSKSMSLFITKKMRSTVNEI